MVSFTSHTFLLAGHMFDNTSFIMSRLLHSVQPTLVKLKTIVLFTAYSVNKYIICFQITFYATIEPYICVIILPIAREEVGGLVPKIMFKF